MRKIPDMKLRIILSTVTLSLLALSLYLGKTAYLATRELAEAKTNITKLNQEVSTTAQTQYNKGYEDSAYDTYVKKQKIVFAEDDHGNVTVYKREDLSPERKKQLAEFKALTDKGENTLSKN
jgi:hypothetical protein